jgi:hypothetical protein
MSALVEPLRRPMSKAKRIENAVIRVFGGASEAAENVLKLRMT